MVETSADTRWGGAVYDPGRNPGDGLEDLPRGITAAVGGVSCRSEEFILP